MSKTFLFALLALLSHPTFAQTITKPVGCFAGTNGTHPDVLAHPEARGVLLIEKWSEIEPSPGVYDFTALDSKINTVTGAGQKYALAIGAGAFGSPDWLIDSLNVSYHAFQYQNQSWRLPLWWDTVCAQKLSDLIVQLGSHCASDTMLSHVYVSQMTVNGIEGHLNGVNMAAFAADGYTDQKWISSAQNTAHEFSQAFPDKPIVFEVHEINQDTLVPAAIVNDLTNNPSLCNRVGLGMWWISGKTSYQTDLLEFIRNYQGDKYAQVIGRSDQVHRFKDSLYSSVFAQAKDLHIRYIEPWPYEFQHNTHDSLLQDFNLWADSNFSPLDSCSTLTGTGDVIDAAIEPVIYPNPSSGALVVRVGFPFERIETDVYDLSGQRVLAAGHVTELDIRHLPAGVYFVRVVVDGEVYFRRVVRE